MSKPIHQTILLPAPAEALYGMYLDPAAHQAITGGPVVVAGRADAEFAAFDSALTGKILVVVPPRLIVQSWRSTSFQEGDSDSTLILSFTPEGDQGRIDLIHLDVPDHDYEGVSQGWHKYYWEPWRAYIERL